MIVVESEKNHFPNHALCITVCLVVCRLFDANSPVGGKLYISYTFKIVGESATDVYLVLRGRDGTKWRCLVLAGEDDVGSIHLARLQEEELLRVQPPTTVGDGHTRAKRLKDDRGLLQVGAPSVGPPTL